MNELKQNPNPVLAQIERLLTTMLLRLRPAQKNSIALSPHGNVDSQLPSNGVPNGSLPAGVRDGRSSLVGSRSQGPDVKFSLPPIQQTLPLAESIHRALIRKAAKGRQINCPELTGHQRNGQPLSGSHQHAHILPIDLDHDGFLDHIVIHAPMGLGPTAQFAIAQLKTLYREKGAPWLALNQVLHADLNRWFCTKDDPLPLADPIHETPLPPHRLIQQPGATHWVSLTPFVPPRYLKKSGKNAFEGQLNAELNSRNFPPAQIALAESSPTTQWLVRRHAGHAQPPQSIGFCLKLQFAEPVAGPICLGYASHFGLGLFRACD